MSTSSFLFRRAGESQVGTNDPLLLNVWLSFQIFAGHIFLPILFVIFCFSGKAKRNPTLINMCIVWIISGIASCLLFYTGTHQGPEPPIGLCLAQASLVYGVTPMMVIATFALVFQVFLGIASSTKERFATKDPGMAVIRTSGLLVFPYVLFGIFATATAWIGYKDQLHVTRNRRFFYCSLENAPLTNTLAIVDAAMLLITIFFEGWIALLLSRNWRALRKAGAGTGLDFSLILRVIGFGIYVLIGTCLSLLSIVAPKNPVPDLWLASVGPAVVLIFGTQRDIFRAVLFWREEAEVTRVARLPHYEREKGSFIV